MHKEMLETLEKIKRKLTGHYAYYGVDGNYNDLNNYYKYVKNKFYNILTRRGQRNQISYSLYIMNQEYLNIPKPRILVNIGDTKII